MPPVAADPNSAALVVVFTIGLIALMQAIAWARQREPGMLWFALASLLSTFLVASGALPMQRGTEPAVAALLAMYAVRSLFALGLTDCLGETTRMRRVTVAVLVFPELVFGVVLLSGVAPIGLWAALPMFWTDLGLALACLLAHRRDRRAGHALVAIAPLIGPVSVMVDIVQRAGPRPGLHFTIAAIGFGIIVLVVGLMRRSRDSRLAQAHAQRMSNYYAALSRTNQAILRTTQPDALYEAVCHICADVAQARLACVIVADGQFARRVAPTGPAAHLFDALPNPWDISSPEGRSSFAAQVLRTGLPIICNDFRTTPPAAYWLKQATLHGFRSMAFLPLRRDARTVACLMIASADVGIFDAPMLKLLDEMTNDISNALDNFDRAAQHLESSRQVEAGLERFARLFEGAPVASAIIAVGDRRVIDVNDAMCELHRAPRDALIGRTTDSLAYHSVAEDRERFYEVLARDGHVRNMVVRMTDDAERESVELMNAEPIDYLGQPCVIFMSLDITDMQAGERAREALVAAEAASRAKTQFLSSMSHELRTPLNAVLGFSGLLRLEAADRLSTQQLAQLDHVQQAGWHLLRLINDVLDLSRIEAGQFGIELRGVELGPLLDEAIQMSQPLATQGSIVLEAGYRDAPAAWALADPTRLRQVVLNLLSNAIKYNREAGTVRIEVSRQDGHAAIEVTDSGLGMSLQQLAHLFEPFNRLGRERQGYEGTGIGLSLARQLMQLMNGQVHVTSEEGRGTRVVLMLPEAADSSKEADAGARGASPRCLQEGVAPRGSVLYIEDNAVNTLLVEQLLARWPDVRFSAAPDGTTGLQMALSQQPDLVLLDLQLPDLDGMDVLKRLRAHDALRDTPIIVLSASAMPEEIALARSRGATDYWTKPLDFEHFLAGIASTLGRVEVE
jgi:PAS domain S-box-containing protein